MQHLTILFSIKSLHFRRIQSVIACFNQYWWPVSINTCFNDLWWPVSITIDRLFQWSIITYVRNHQWTIITCFDHYCSQDQNLSDQNSFFFKWSKLFPKLFMRSKLFLIIFRRLSILWPRLPFQKKFQSHDSISWLWIFRTLELVLLTRFKNDWANVVSGDAAISLCLGRTDVYDFRFCNFLELNIAFLKCF